MIIEDWDDFLDYLNHTSGTDDFDAEKLMSRQRALDREVVLGEDEINLQPTAGAQVICDGLWKIIKRNPVFHEPADKDNIATVHGMMAKEGWYLESTFFDPDRDTPPYIFYAYANPTGYLESALFAIWFTFEKYLTSPWLFNSASSIPSKLVVNKWQLVHQKYEANAHGEWVESPEAEDEDSGWAAPGFGYMMSESPILHGAGKVINFPYETISWRP